MAEKTTNNKKVRGGTSARSSCADRHGGCVTTIDRICAALEATETGEDGRKTASELANVVRFAYATGWRTASEVLPLEWRQVDWAGRCVRLDPGTTKNGEGRSFPFTADI